MANSKRKKTSGYFVTVGTGEKIQYNSNPTRSKPKVTETQKQAAEARVQQYRSAAKENASTQSGLSKPAKITSDVSGEAWTRATPSQVKLPSGYTTSQQSELNRLQELRRQAQVDLDTDTLNSVDKRMKELRAQAGKQTAGDRASDVLSTIVSGSGSSLVNTAGFISNAYNDPDFNRRQIAQAQKALETGRLSDGKVVTPAMRKTLQDNIDRMNREIAEWESENSTTNRIYRAVDRMQNDSAAFQESAKQGLGKVGSTIVDAAVSMGQSTLDAVPAMVTGGAAGMAPFVVRAFGGATQEARRKGADLNQQFLYGSAEAAKEYVTEKLFGLTLPQKMMGNAGKGLADASVEGLIDAGIKKALGRIESEFGQKAIGGIATWLASGVTEGAEEIIGSAIENAFINPNLRAWEPDTRTRQQKFEDALYDGLVGAVSGLMGGVTNLATYDTSKLSPAKTTRSGVTVDAKNRNAYNETKVSPAASAQVQQTEVRAQVTRAENPGSTVLDAATTLFTQQGMKLKTAQEKAGIVQKLIAGEEVSVRDINKLNPTSRESQAIFTQLTGVQFPEGKVTQERLYNLYRSAHDVAVQAQSESVAIDSAEGRETFPAFNRYLDENGQEIPSDQMSEEQILEQAKTIRGTANPENDARAAQALAQMRGEIAPDGNALLSFKEFSDFIKQQNPKATREATARLYDQYLKDNQTVEYRGQRLSHMQFMDMVRNAPRGSELTEAEAEDLWQREVKRQQDLNYNKEDSNGRGEDLVHSAGLSGVSDQSAGGQGSGVSEAAGRAEGDGGTRRGNQTGSRAGQSRESVSEEVSRKTGGGFRELRIGDQAVTEVLPEVYTPEMQTAVERFNGTSANVHVVLEGYPIPGTSSFADGITIRQKDGRIDVYLQATSRLSLEGRANHELSHVAMFDNPEVKYQAIRALKESTSEQELEDLVVAYQTMYGNAYADSDDLIGDLLEEIVCDAYAGLNRANAGAPKYRSAVSAALDPQMQTYTAAYRESLALTDDSGNLVVESDDKGHSRFSLRTFKDSGREILDKWMRRAVVKGDLTQQDADDILSTIDTIYDVCEKYKDDYGPFSVWSDAKVVTDEKGNPVFSVVKANGDYSMNLDFSLVCKKRRTLDAVLNELVQRGFADNLALGQEDIVKINDVIREHGFETACALCFVDAKRFRQGKVADDFVKLYNDMVLSLIPENSGFEAQYFNFGGDSTITEVSNPIDQMPNSQLDFTHINEVLKTYGSKTVEHKVAKLLKNSAQDRKLTKRGDFLSTRGFDAINRQNPRVLKLFNAKKGSGGPKSAVSDVQYLNEVLKPNSFKQEKAYAVGGVRIQSFSDYVPRMVFDYVQMIADLSAKKLPAYAYTKEELFVKQFGLTGMKINMSLIPKVVDDGIAAGLDADGNYVWADESFDYDEALKIQNAEGYSRNCGTIAVGVSDEHIRALMADPDIRMVIPYHKSGLNPIVAKMNKIEAFTDYTDYQNTRHKDGTKLNPDNAVDKKLLKDAPNFNQRLHELGENGDPRQVVAEYVKWCEDNDLLPKFDQFLYQQVDGVFVEQDGHKVIDPNYYKLIEDFTVYVGDAYVAQGPLSMTFPTEDSAFGSMADLIKRGLEEDAVLEGKRDSEVGAIVDEIIRGSRTTDAAMQDDSGMAFYDTEKKYSVLVEDKDTLDFLNNQKTIKTYKTMQLVDGKLYPPMASRINGKFEDASELGKWEQATEHPELIKNGNKFKLDKGKGNGSIEAAYNPYMHSSNLVINDQFTGAYTRDNLVTVECEVPVSEVTSGYHAEYAKDSVGWHSWHTGTVAGQIRKEKGIERQVFLSRWIKPVRIVPDSEVASMYKTLLDGTDIAVPDNVVTPSLRDELKKAGVKLQESGKVRYSIIANPDLSFAEQVDLVSRNRLNEVLEPGTSYQYGLTDSALYVQKEPNPMMQELGYGDYALVVTQDHIRQMLGKREDSAGNVINEHNHQLTVDQVSRIPELLRSPAAVLVAKGRPESLVFVTTEADYKGRPIIIPVKANGTNLAYDSVEGPAHVVTSMYGRDDFGKFFSDAVNRGELVYYKKERIDPILTNAGYQSSGLLSGIDSDTIVGQVNPIVKNPGDRKFSITQDSEGRELTQEQKEFFKDSKVLDDTGHLKVMFHGTNVNKEFNIFDTYGGKFGLFGNGSYFTDTKTVAESYTQKERGTNPRVYEVYLNITNPLDMDAAFDLSSWDVSDQELKSYIKDAKTNEEMFRQLKEYCMDQDMVKWEAEEFIRDFIQYTGGYDGITHIGGGRYGSKDGPKHRVYIAFEPEQIKNVTNQMPTNSADIRYSITQDSTGRELTKEQQEFFKDSKVRDDEGRLTPVYHGTPNGGFTEFKLPKYMSSLMSSYGPGFYFTDKNNARQYMKPVNKSKIPGTRAKLYETYLNITNPFEMSGYQHTLTKDQVVEILKNGNYDWFFEKGMFHELGLEPGSLSREKVIEQYADKLLRSQYGDQDVISEIVKAYTGEDNNILDVLKKVTGNDGLHWKDGYGDIWVAWDAKQIKNVSNKKPTESTDIRYSITPEFEQWYKENFGGEDLTDAQLQRRLEYAKQKENDILVSKQAAKTKQDVDQRYKDLTAWMMYHERKMREQRQTLKDRSKAVQQSMKADKNDALQKQAEIHKAELAVARNEKVKALKDNDLAWRIYSQQQARNAAADKDEALKTARKEANAEKAEAVRTTKEVERAKAEVQHDADMMAMKREAAKRLRVKEDAYQRNAEQRKENQKLKRNAAKQALRDSKLAAKKRAEAEVKQGAVDTIRKNPASRSAVEKLQERASQLRTLGRSAYRTFVNQALHIDELAKRQVEGTRASTLVTVLGGANDTVATIYKNGLVDRAGNTIGESMKDVFLCWDIKGKKVDQNKQALLQDYMLHQHNVDRMSFVDRARTRLETFEQENPWLSQMDTKEFARLVAMTDAEIQSTGKQEAHDKAVQYARLLHEYDTAQNKPIFGDSDGNAVTADTSRQIVQQYLSENPWLEEKAQGIYDWWDKFMRTWAVGDSITEAEYNTMRELYPHYVPTYRADKKGVGAANFVGANGASIGKAVKKAKGGMSEVLNIEDSFSNLVSKIVRLERTNELYMNMIDSAMLDNDDTFSDMIVFDWDWQDGQYGKTLEIGALLNGDLDARYDDAEAAGLSKVGQDRKLTAWHNGRQYSAYISEDLFKSIANVTGTVANDLEKNLIKLGNTLTGPMKTAITGINPTFALRNVSRDLPTAITNSISGLAFPKYWAQAAAEIAKNSENWQHFQALGGTNATYYNDQNGFVKSMEQRDGIGAKAVNAMGAFNEVTEAQTRFAEYLATIDRLGDTYENRLLGIKNAAEVTVDFSRKGRAGKLINAWVPYWNPAVQGVDKVVRSVIDSPDGSAVWKQAAKTVGRASMTTVLFEAILYAVLKGMGRYDDWEELDDRTKDTYYCIPYGKSNTFIKVPKNREWGAILGTPFMRLLEYANGRENPFENYIETSLEPNFLPGQILAPREGGGFQSDVIGFSQALDLQANKDFAGRTIVPYAYQQGSITQQYDENTSWFAKKLGDLLNFSPMQIDYIIKDYFGDFGDLAVSATSDAVLKGTESLPEKATDLLTGSFKTDNRYSNYTVSKYYDTLEKLEQTVQDRKNQMEGDSYQDTVEYQTKSALDKLYGKQISELNKQVRNSTDQEERDNLKGQIAELAGQALEYYQDCMSGKVENPVLDAQYANLPSAVSKELIRLDGYSKDYGIKPTGNPSAKYTDPKNKNKEYVLTDEQKDKFKDIYQEQYAQTFSKVIGSSKYKSASDEKKANLLENARDDVLEDTKDEFFKWLKKTGAKSTAKKK